MVIMISLDYVIDYDYVITITLCLIRTDVELRVSEYCIF